MWSKFNVNITNVFLFAGMTILILGFIKSKPAFFGVRYKGQRLAAIIHLFALAITWTGTAAATAFGGPYIFSYIWPHPDRVALVVSVVIGVTAYQTLKFIVKKIFGGESTSFQMFSRGFSQEQRRTIAVHESGHLLLHAGVELSALPKTVAVLGGGLKGVAGYVRSMKSVKQSRMPNAAWMTWECQMLLAGVLAEYVIYESGTYGAGSDMERWNEIAQTLLRSGLTRYPFPLSDDQTSRQVRMQSYKELLQEHRTSVHNFLTVNQKLLFQTANELQAKKKLDDTDCRRILKQVKGREYITILRQSDLEI